MNNGVDQRRLIRAFLASIATGVVVYLLVIRGALPVITRRLTSTQIDWLRGVFGDHPWIVLGSIAVIAAILALPVLIAFRIAYGPMKGLWRLSARRRQSPSAPTP